LGIGCAVQSFNSVLCADTSHLYVDESTAPEMFTGCRIIPLATNSDGKIEIETIRKSIIRRGDEHYPQIKVFSIAQTTEYGTVYTKEELTAIGKLLKEHDTVFHMDGARLFNSAVSLNCSLKEITNEVGVDILSVGGTKIGLLFGEAVVFFDKKYAENLRYRQKQSMQLPSKMRFISAQFLRLLRDEIWITSATHANKMARRLFDGIKNIQKIKITRTVQANAVFAVIPVEWNKLLQNKAAFHVWNENTNEVRWMCAFDTEENEIDEFISLIHNL
jgi:threonine aldolase